MSSMPSRVVTKGCLFALALLLAACSTTSGADSGTSSAISEVDAPARDLPYPEQTRSVLAIRPDRAPDAVGSVRTFLGAARGSPPGEAERGTSESGESESPSPASRAATAAVAGMLDARGVGVPQIPGLYRQLAEPSGDWAGRLLTAIDTDRPLLFAMSTRFNKSVLRTLRLGAPAVDASVLPTGPTGRLFLPAAEGTSELKAQIEKLCGEDRSQCASVPRVASHDSWVVVDVGSGLSPDEGSGRGGSSGPDWSGSDEEYFERATPAARAFLESDAALSMYIRTEDVAELGAVIGAFEARNALANAAPTNRTELYNKGLSIAGTVFEFSDPEARETEDASLEIDAPRPGAWSAEVVSTHTAHGRAVADAGAIDARLPQLEAASPVLEFEFAADTEAALDEARPPRPLRRAAENGDWGRVAEMLRTGGAWGWYSLVGSAPMGSAAALQEWIAQRSANLGGSKSPPTEQVYAVRASLGTTPDAKAPVGFVPTGGIALLVDREGRLVELIEKLVGRLDAGTPVTAAVDRRKREGSDRTVVEITFGGAEDVFGAASAVAGGPKVRLRANRLPDLPRMGPSGSAARRVLSSAEVVRLDARHSRRGRAVRFHAGPEDPADLSVPRARTESATAGSRPECLIRASAASRRALSAYGLGMGGDGNWFDHHSELDDKLQSHGKDCPEDASDATARIRWLRGRWLRARSFLASASWDFPAATEAAEKACALEDDSDCAFRERFATLAGAYRPPETAAHLRVEDIPREQLMIGHSRTFYPPVPEFASDGERPGAGDVSALVGAVEAGASESGETWSERFTLRGIPTGAGGRTSVALLPIDRTHSARFLGRLNAYVDDLEVPVEYRQERKLLRKPVPPADVTGMALHVRPDGARESGYPFVVLRASLPDASEGTEAVSVEVSSEGIDLRNPDGEAVASIDACEGRSPTLCVRDAETVERTLESIEKAPADADSEAFRRLAEQYRLDALDDRVAAVDSSGPSTTYELRVDPAIPAGLVARIAGRIGTHTLERHDRPPQILFGVQDDS